MQTYDKHTLLIRAASPNNIDALVELCAEHAAYEEFHVRSTEQKGTPCLSPVLSVTAPVRLGGRAVRETRWLLNRDKSQTNRALFLVERCS